MQKKLIALAIASAISAPALADNANFTFYGIADVSYDVINTGNTNTTSGAVKRNVSSNVSRFGFKGSEDLGDGLAAIWQVEQQINLDGSGTSTFATRNTFGGLKHESFGTVLMGRHDTPYKLTTRKLDVFGDSIADNRSFMGGVSSTTAGVFVSAGAAFDGRQPDVLAYISPALAGVTVALATVNLTETQTTSISAHNSATSVGVMFDAAPFYAAVGYESHTLNSNATATKGNLESAKKLGFGLNLDALSLGLVLEKTSDNLGANKVNLYGHSAVYVSGKYSIGNSAIKLAAGKVNNMGGALQTGANQITVGYDHGLSKRTKLYVLYTKLNNRDAANYKFSQSTAAADTSAGLGSSPSALSIGLKQTF